MPEHIFKLVFLSQVATLSFVVPRMVARRMKAGQSRYLMVNNVAAVAGVLCLSLFSLHPAFESMTRLLLGIGVFFGLQLVPLVMAIEHLSGLASPGPRDSFSLLAAVRPIVVGTAAVLFLSYLVLAIVLWDRTFGTDLLQIAIFVGTNLFLVVNLRLLIRDMEKADPGNEKALRIGNLYRIAPLFVYVSIVLSVYYLGKELLFGLELEPYRPVMMSAFLQLIGVLAISQLSNARTRS